MAKYIKLTDDIINQCKDDFAQALTGVKMSEGKISFIKTFTCEKKTATIFYTTGAWLKLQHIISYCDKEVAWHGLVKRNEQKKDEFIVYDIEVYPQTVTGATVNTDQVKYQMWLMDHDDEVFSDIRMQGHSHVRMGVTPSTVDTNHQEQILEQLGDNDYYIFQIWNKDGRVWSKIYDMEENIMYETSDVETKILSDVVDYNALTDEINSLVKEKTYSKTSTIVPYNGSNTSKTDTNKTSNKKNEKKKETKKGKFASEDAMGDYFSGFYNYAWEGYDY